MSLQVWKLAHILLRIRMVNIIMADFIKLKIVRFSGQEDIAILHVEDKAVHPKTGILKITQAF